MCHLHLKLCTPSCRSVFFALPELLAVFTLDVNCQLEQHASRQSNEQINGMKAGQRICKGCVEHGKAVCQLVDERCAGCKAEHSGDLIRKVKSADGSPPNWKWRCPERLKPKGAPPGKRASRRCRPPRLRSGAGFQGHPALPDAGDPEKPYLIVTSENAPEVYLAYLKERGISWIAAERGKIHLSRPLEPLTKEFGL